MKLLASQYSIHKKALELYTAGCKPPHCKGCHNPETWNFDQGTDWKEYVSSNLDLKIETFDDMIDRIMIFGGEPLDNDEKDVIEFLTHINQYGKEIWLFTRYLFHEISLEIKHLCDYIKCGRYIEEKKVDNYVNNEYVLPIKIQLATSNQLIYKIEK